MTILAHSSGDQDVLMKINGESVPIDTEIQIPEQNMEKVTNESSKLKLVLYYLDNDPDLNEVTHSTEVSVNNTALSHSAIFRDNTETSSDDMADWKWYFIAPLNEYYKKDENAVQKNYAIIKRKQ